MKRLKKFVIPITGLETGSHQFEFTVDVLFFEPFGENEINDCEIILKIKLLKQEDAIVLDFSYSGFLELTCDRCLDLFRMDIDGYDIVTLKFSKKRPAKKSDEESISPEAKEIDVRQYIYDFVSLKIPIRKVHPENDKGESQCDKEVIKKIEELSIKNTTDPRWDKLKDLQNN